MAGEQQNVKIEVQLGNSVSLADAFSKSLKGQAQTAEQLAQQIAELNAQSGISRASIRGLTDANEQYEVVLKRIGGQLKATKLFVNDLSSAYRSASQAARDAIESQRGLQASKQAAQTLTTPIEQGGFGFDPSQMSAKLKAEADQAQIALSKALASPILGPNSLDSAIKNLNAGILQTGNAAENRLLQALLKARDVTLKMVADQQSINKGLTEEAQLRQQNAQALLQAKAIAATLSAAEVQAARDRQVQMTAQLAADNQAKLQAALQARQQASQQGLKRFDINVTEDQIRKAFPAPPGGTIEQLARYEALLSKIKASLLSGSVSKSDVNNILSAFDQGKVAQGLSPAANQVQGMLAQLRSEYGKSQDVGVKAGNALAQSWTRLSQIMTVTAIHQIVGRLTTAFQKGVQDAADFQIKIAEIRTIAQDNQLTFDQWSKGVNDLSSAFGRSQTDVATGAYQILSNQTAKGAAVFGTLRTALELGRTTVSTTEEAVNALTGAMSGFQLGTADEDRVAATLFKTVELGRIRLSELSNTIGRTGPAATILGISLEEVSAALATLTNEGIRNSDATTLTTNIILKLLKPTADMKELFKELGVESGQMAIATFGLGGFLQKMAEAVGNNVERYGELGGELRAIKGFIGLARDGTAAYKTALEGISGAQETYTRAVGEFVDNRGQEFIKQINQVKIFFSQEIGTALLDSLLKVTSYIGGISNAVRVGAYAAGSLAAAWGILRLGSLAFTSALVFQNAAQVANIQSMNQFGRTAGAMQIATTRWHSALAGLTSAAGALGLAFVAVQTAFSVIQQSSTFSSEVTSDLEAIRDSQKQITLSSTAEAAKQAAAYEGGVNKQYQTIFKFTKDATKLASDLSNAIKSNLERANENLKISFTGLTSFLSNRIRDLNKTITESKTHLEQSQKSVADFSSKSQESQFQRQEKFESNPTRSVQRISGRIAQLQADNNRLQGRNDQESIEQIRRNSDEIIKLIEQREDKLVEIRRKQAEMSARAGQPSGNINEFGEREIDVSDIVAKGQQAINAEVARRTQLEQRYQAALTETGRIAKAQLLLEQLRKKSVEDAAKAVQDFSVLDKEGKVRPEIKGKDTQESANKAIAEFDSKVKKLLESAGGDKQVEAEIKKILEVEEKRKSIGLQVNAILQQDRMNKLKLDLEAQKDAEIKASRDAREAAKKATEDQTTALDSLDKKLKDIEAATKRLTVLGAGTKTIMGVSILDPLTKFGGTKKYDQAEAGFQTALKNAQEEQRKLREGDNSPEQIARVKASLDKLMEAYNTLGQAAQRAGFEAGKLNELLAPQGNKGAVTANQVFSAAANDIERISKAASTLQAAQANLEGTRSRLGELSIEAAKAGRIFANLPESAKAATDAITNGMRDSESQTSRLIAALKDVADQIAMLNKQSLKIPVSPLRMPNADEFASGGLVNWKAKGRDTVPVMLDPEEFVMTRQATRRFFPQIMAMHSGFAPKYMSQGGPVTNVGDIKVISESSGSYEQSGRQIARAIRREIRRGNIN